MGDKFKLVLKIEERFNACVFRGKCLSSDYSYYIRKGDCE